jgi:hypothetical protein
VHYFEFDALLELDSRRSLGIGIATRNLVTTKSFQVTNKVRCPLLLPGFFSLTICAGNWVVQLRERVRAGRCAQRTAAQDTEGRQVRNAGRPGEGRAAILPQRPAAGAGDRDHGQVRRRQGQPSPRRVPLSQQRSAAELLRPKGSGRVMNIMCFQWWAKNVDIRV